MEGVGSKTFMCTGAWAGSPSTTGWKVQEDTQKHHDQPDGHSGGGHQKTGERSGTARALGVGWGTAPGADDSQEIILATGIPE